MKKIKLHRLKLEDFKGIKDREIQFDGVDKYILGTNEVGKSTIFDAFTWLLFDKNSEGKAEFKIKTLDKDNNVIHNLDHTVEGDLEIKKEGQEAEKVTLRKEYKEKWTRKRGQQDQEFGGHTTDYFINGVPKKKKKYDQYINEIITEDLFKQITDSLYFNEQLHWSDRREVIFSLGDQPSVEEVAKKAAKNHKGINADRLIDELKNKTTDEYSDMLKHSRKKIKEKLKEIPARIDEANRSLPEGGVDKARWKELEQELEDLKDDRQAVKDKLDELKSGEVKLKQQIANKKAELSEKRIELKNEKNYEIEELRNQIAGLKDQFIDKKREVKQFEQEGEDKKKRLEKLKKKRKDLLDKYHKWDEKEFNKEDKKCPECGQLLPEDEIEEHRQEFNQKKSNKLEEILQEGKETKKEIEELEEWLDYTERPATDDELEDLQAEIEGLEEAKSDLIEEKLQAPELQSLRQELKELENQDPADLSSEEEEELQDKLEDIEQQISDTDRKILEIENAQKAKKRIEELQEMEQNLIEKENEIENRQFELEEFMVVKTNIMTESINNKFDLVEWKLFEKQVNGALSETCEVLKGGVPYSDLNTGSKYQAGMDIIKTLCRIHQVEAPVFIDNRERIAELPEIPAQTIHLIMAPDYEELTVKGVDFGTADQVVKEEGGPKQETLF